MFMALGSAALFALLHGRGYAVLESRFRQTVPLLQSAAACLLPLAVVTAIEGFAQYFLTAAGENIPSFLTPGQAGPFFSSLLDVSRIILIILTVLILWRFYAVSAGYYPLAVHTLGAILFIQEIWDVLHAMNITGMDYLNLKMYLLWCLFPYGCGAVLALLFHLYIWRARQNGKEG